MAPRSHHQALADEASVSADGGSGTTTTSTTSSSSVKPGCMIELARLAKIPPPASGLMCPRCDSTDTKFCYYNNYSLSQPRHFCKTCRRYWTHGGAIRDIPLASTIRRRHRLTKPSSSKHTITTASKQSSACFASATGGRAPSCSSSGGATVPIKLEQQCWYLPKRQHLSFFSYTNGVIAPTTASAISPFRVEFGGADEAAGFADGQMKAVSMVPGSSSLVASSVMMMEESPPSTKMGAVLTSSPRQFMGLQQGEDDEPHYFLGSGSWTCGYGGGGTSTGSGGTVATPGNVWAEDLSGFTSSTSWNIL